MHDFISFYHRLRKNSDSIGRWARRHNIEAYRLYDRDIPQFPFSIDRYGDKLHLQEYNTGWQISEKDYQAWLKEIVCILSKVTAISHRDIFLKKRERKRGKHNMKNKHVVSIASLFMKINMLFGLIYIAILIVVYF